MVDEQEDWILSTEVRPSQTLISVSFLKDTRENLRPFHSSDIFIDNLSVTMIVRTI